ncbi:hypothetical protein B0H11DRAFT_1934976 [Mycena galericulata]|nr:hypothetical protein B0H11DRAFT_1934976 [Mycena galericulata]
MPRDVGITGGHICAASGRCRPGYVRGAEAMQREDGDRYWVENKELIVDLVPQEARTHARYIGVIKQFRGTMATAAKQKHVEKVYNASTEQEEHPRSGLERCVGGSQREGYWPAGTGSGERGGANEEAEVKKSPIITRTNNAIPS